MRIARRNTSNAHQTLFTPSKWHGNINVMAGRQHGVRPERFIMDFALFFVVVSWFAASLAACGLMSLVAWFVAEVS